MRRPIPAARCTVAAVAVLLTGCSAATTAPVPSATATAPASTAPASTAPAATQAPTAAATAWAAKYCSAAAPVAKLTALPKPDSSTPAATKASIVAFATAGAAAFAQAASAIATVGPPPVAGNEQLTQQAAAALNTSATQFAALATKANATDPADAAAMGVLVTGFSDAIGSLRNSFATLNRGLAPELTAALATAPECSALGR